MIVGYNYLKGSNLFKKERIFYVHYPNVEELSPDAAVTVNGLQIGKVRNITISPEATDVIVSFIIDKKDYYFSKTSTVLLYNAGLIGGKALAIVPDYENTTRAESGDTLSGKMEKGMMDVISDKVLPLGDDLGSALASLDTLVGNLNEVLDDKSRDHLKSTFENIDNTVTSLSDATASINKLLDVNNSKINTSIENIEKASDNFVKLSDSLATLDTHKLVAEIENTITSLNNVVNNLESGEGSIGKLLKDDSLYLNLESASKELEQLMRDIKLHPKRYVHFSIFGKKNREYIPEE